MLTYFTETSFDLRLTDHTYSKLLMLSCGFRNVLYNNAPELTSSTAEPIGPHHLEYTHRRMCSATVLRTSQGLVRPYMIPVPVQETPAHQGDLYAKSWILRKC